MTPRLEYILRHDVWHLARIETCGKGGKTIWRTLCGRAWCDHPKAGRSTTGGARCPRCERRQQQQDGGK
jgi:hypothetical protein